jgi:large subunit ribosomal protein L25
MYMTAIQAEKRTPLNSSGLRSLRRSGRLPGVVFGKNAENFMIHISAKQFQSWLRQGASGMIKLQMGNSALPVLLEDLQRDPLTREPIHVDFQLVQSGVPLRTKLPLKLAGTPIGTKQGGVVQVQSSFVEVEGLPEHLPAEIEIDVSGMNIGDTVLVKDLKLPENVTAVSDENESLLAVVKL